MFYIKTILYEIVPYQINYLCCNLDAFYTELCCSTYNIPILIYTLLYNMYIIPI